MALPMVPIYTQTVGAGGAASVTFNNIPQYFTDLKILVSARTSSNATDAILHQFNGNSTGVYSQTRLEAQPGTAVFSDRFFNQINGGVYTAVADNSRTASTFGSLEMYIPNYTAANFKSAIVDAVYENNATFVQMDLNADLFRDTTAISSVRFFSANGGNFVQYSTFSLYGIIRPGA